MRQPVTLQWINNNDSVTPTRTTIQRCSQLNFSHPKAQIDVIANGTADGLNPTSKTGYYIDYDVEPGRSYSYRVIQHTQDSKASSVNTNHIHVHDLVNDIGYPDGSPDQVCTYNIKSKPILHIDAQRLTGFSPHNNDVIKSARSMIRFQHDDVKNIYITGDPIYDTRSVGGVDIQTVAKTSTPYQQMNACNDLKNTQLSCELLNDFKSPNYTLFYVLCDDYNDKDSTSVFEICSNQTISWNRSKITCKLPTGQQTVKRITDDFIKTICVRASDNFVCVWENSNLVYKKSNTKNKTSLNWLAKSGVKILANDGSSIGTGLCEYIMFDDALDNNSLNCIVQYMNNKYKTLNNDLFDTRDTR